jgi:hypothetical protein
MSRRTVKQIVYGIFYLIIIFALVYGVYFFTLKPEPSCFDGKQNQNEEGIDCGGPCPPCELKILEPIKVLLPQIISIDEKTSVLIELLNPNVNWGVEKFFYELNFYDLAGEKIFSQQKESFIYPGERKYIAEINLDIDYRKIDRIEILPLIKEEAWKLVSEFSAPKISTREILTEYNPNKKQIVISGIFTNKNPFIISKAVIGVIILDNFGRRIGISKTLLSNIKSAEERVFKIILPVKEKLDFDPRATEIFVEAKR